MNKLFFFLLVSTAAVTAGEYTVQPGDTLSKIAQSQLGDTDRWKEIADINDIKKPFTVKVGQVLILPAAGTDDHESIEEILNAPQSGELEPEGSSGVNWLLILIGSIVSWIFWSICLKAGCWFSLVEISWKKSFLFPFFMILGILALTCVVYFTGWRSSDNALSWLAVISLLALITTIIFLKRYFDCKWRSVLTVLVMTSALANILSLITMLALSYAIPDIARVQELFNFFQS